MPGRFQTIQQPSRHFRSQLEDYNDGRVFASQRTSTAEEKKSLDLTQRLEEKLAAFNASDNVWKRWILEITCWTVSALSMGAVAGIYLRLDNHSMSGSEWLLTWVNVLGKVAAAALIVPTSEALGQLKWNWFHKSRAMWDFEIFDKASRGPWGAVMLLFRTKGRSLAAFGALLIVLLLAIDTFFQQVVDYPDRWRMMGSVGEIPRIVRYEPRSPPQFWQNSEQLVYNRELIAVMRQYFFGNGTQPVPFGNGIRPEIPLSCPTSNCTWPIYDTLAVCSRCEEVSAVLEITHTCMKSTVDWSAAWTGPVTEEPYPNKTVCGHFLNATSDRPVLLTGYIADGENSSEIGETLLMRNVPLTDFDTKEPKYGVGSIAFKEVRNPLLDALIVSAINGLDGVLQGEAPLVTECIVSWCVQTVESSYDSGIYREEVLAEVWNTTNEHSVWPWHAEKFDVGLALIYWDNVTIQATASSAAANKTTPMYFVSNLTALEAMTLFDDFFPASYTVNNETSEPLMRYRNYDNGPWTLALDFNPWLAPNNLTRHMERLATTMTNVIRSSPSKEMLKGDAYAVEKYIRVQWAWLIFPVTLLLLSLAFLVSTIIKTSKDTETGVWKTSTMPTLLYGLPEDQRGTFAPGTTWNSSHNDTKRVRIRLLPNLGWRVSGQSLLKSPLLPVRRNQPPPGWI